MIAHPQYANEYSKLKEKLAEQFPLNIEGYMQGKSSFIQQIDTIAANWSKK